MKTLFVLVGNGGDGSYHPQYTFNEKFIDYLENSDNDDYMDGDGFHYDTITVPDECTLENMGLSDCAEGYEDELEDEDE
jgi:hypothetical protein